MSTPATTATYPSGEAASEHALLDVARSYAQRGWYVFPCYEPGTNQSGCSCNDLRERCKHPAKHPRTPHGFTDASLDPDQIERWWSRWPGANIGIDCGRSGLLVLDLDGAGGVESLDSLEREHGALPNTLTATTGKGEHRYYQLPEDADGLTAVTVWPGLDIRAVGSYVIAPPSRHASGTTYTWANELAPAPAPRWLVEEIRAHKRTRTTNHAVASSDGFIAEGSRNDTLMSIAGSMRHRGLSAGEMLPSLLAVNQSRCTPPLTEDEVRGIALSVTRYEPAMAAVRQTNSPSERTPTLDVDALLKRALPGGDAVLDVPATPPALWGRDSEVLWADGESCMLVGGDGTGKTTLAQRVVRAGLGLDDGSVLGYPVQSFSGRVLYLAADRPQQAQRSLSRMSNEAERHALNECLTIWPGPLPFNLLTQPSALLEFALALDCRFVVIDSIKDVILDISSDAGGQAWRGARPSTQWSEFRMSGFGPGFDYMRGSMALRLDRIDEALRWFDTGTLWAQSQGASLLSAHCRGGLAEVAERRGDHALAMQHLDAAGELFSRHGAKLYLDQVLAKKQVLQA